MTVSINPKMQCHAMIQILAQRVPHTTLEDAAAITITCLIFLIWGRIAFHRWLSDPRKAKKARSSKRSGMAFWNRG